MADSNHRVNNRINKSGQQLLPLQTSCGTPISVLTLSQPSKRVNGSAASSSSSNRRSTSTFPTLNSYYQSVNNEKNSVYNNKRSSNGADHRPIDFDWYYYNMGVSDRQKVFAAQAMRTNNEEKTAPSGAESNESPSSNRSINYEDIEAACNRVSKDQLSVDNTEWLSEKPISVLQLDAADRAVLKIADQRDKIQKKTFTKWVNKHLRKVSVEIVELFDDLQSGLNLIYLLESLTGKQLKKEKGSLRFHSLQNVQTCLNFLTEHNIKLVNIRPEEIVDGNPKLTLGLIWIIILHFQIAEISKNEGYKETKLKDALMNWVNKNLTRSGSNSIRDFSHSWRDGRALLNLLYQYIPDKINFTEMYGRENKQNLQLAFELAESELCVTKLLDPEDVDVATPDEKSIITYISSLYNAVSSTKPEPTHTTRSKSVCSSRSTVETSMSGIKDKEKRGMLQEYSLLFKSLHRWLTVSIESMSVNQINPLPNDYIELKSLIADLRAFRLEEYSVRQRDRSKLKHIYSEIKSYFGKTFGPATSVIEPGEEIELIESLWDRLDQVMHEREDQLEQSMLRFEKMKYQYEKLTQEIRNKTQALNSLHNELEAYRSRIKTPKTGALDFEKQIRESIHEAEKSIRQIQIEANQLTELHHPNSKLLTQKLSKLERFAFDLSVSVNNLSVKEDNNQSLNVQSLDEWSSTSTPIKKTNKKNRASKSSSLSSPSTEQTNEPINNNSPIFYNNLNTSSNSTVSVDSGAHCNYNSTLGTSSGDLVQQKYLITAHTSSGPTHYFDSITITTPISDQQAYTRPTTLSKTDSKVDVKLSKTVTSTAVTSCDSLHSSSSPTSSPASNSTFNSPSSTGSYLLATVSKESSKQQQNSAPLVNKLYNLVDEAFKWLRDKQTELNTIEFKTDIALNEIELNKVRHLTTEIKKYHSTLERIDLLKMDIEKTNQQDIDEIGPSLNKIFSSFNSLCKSLNLSHQYLDTLMEFNKLVQDELRYLNEMEDIEYNRDWSQPCRFKSSELIQHKSNVELTLSHKSKKIQFIVSFADKMIEAKHPASSDLSIYVGTLQSEVARLQQLMTILGEHISRLQRLEEFYKTHDELNTYLDSTRARFDHFVSILSDHRVSEADETDKYEEIANQFNVFKHNFHVLSQCRQQIDELVDTINTSLPAYKMRRLSLKSPYDKCRILADYQDVSVKLVKGEVCKIVDNSNMIKWKCVSSESKRDALVPSVYFILNGPDPDLIESMEQMRFKHDQLRDEINKFDFQIKKEKISNMMHGILRETKSSKLVQSAKVDDIVKNVREEIEAIISSTQTISSVKNSSQPVVSSSVLRASSFDDCYGLIHEFKEFDKSLKQIVSQEGDDQVSADDSTFASLEMRIAELRRSFDSITVNNPIVVLTQPDLTLNQQLAQQIKNECKNFEHELNEASNKQEQAIHIAIPKESDSMKSRLSQIRANYKELTNLSGLYDKSVRIVDNLITQIEQFSSNLAAFQSMLDTPAVLEISNINQMKSEMDLVSEMKSLVKKHESSLNTIKARFDELRVSIESVRNLSSTSMPPQHEYEDLRKLDSVITELKERWEQVAGQYASRRANLKKCLYMYHEQIKAANNEKQGLKNVKETPEAAKIVKINKSTENKAQLESKLQQQAKELNAQLELCNQLLSDLNQPDEQLNNKKQPKKAHCESSPVKKAVLVDVCLQLTRAYTTILKPIESEYNEIKTTNNRIELADLDMINYKDFCGSQELDLIKKQSQMYLSSRSSHHKSSGNLRSDESDGSHFFLNDKPRMTNPDSSAASSSSSSSFVSAAATESSMPATSCAISDYRLTLTDLVDLNLIDISNGLLINPMNGARLSISDAVRVGLLNTDIKEIANTFYLSYSSSSNPKQLNTSLKLTIKEAIQLGVLNPAKNEIHLSPSNPLLKLNLYQAKKQNLILKPLTLSEAFLRNLIQPNGYVRNPINNKFYAFESLVINDLNGQQPLYVFDFDTKHIIDPPSNCVNSEKKLLSLREAIESGLILPRTFELSVTTSRNGKTTRNLYEAFLNSTKFNFGLLIYKPEIENAYVKLMTNKKTNESEHQAAQSKLAIILSKRDKIGLCEAINLNVISLKSKTYKFILTNNELSSETISLDEATFRFNLIDRELILLLNQAVENTKLTVIDCINRNYVELDKNIFRVSEFKNSSCSPPVVSLDSQTCRQILGDECVRKIKRLITRVNVKSYLVTLSSLNKNEDGLLRSSSMNMQNLTSSPGTLSATQLVNFKTPNVIHNQLFSNLSSDKKLLSRSSNNIVAPNQQSGSTNLIKETRSYILDYVMVPSESSSGLRQKISIQEAKKRGVLNLEQGLYIDTFQKMTISIDEAIKCGLIGARMAVCEKNIVLDEKKEPVTGQDKKASQSTYEIKKGHESSTLSIDSILDARTGIRLSVNDAISAGILDQNQLVYKNTLTGRLMSLNEAYEKGFVRGSMCSKKYETSNGVAKKKEDSAQIQQDEKCFRIVKVYDPVVKAHVSLEDAIKRGLFDKDKAVYLDPIRNIELSLRESHKLGLIQVEQMNDGSNTSQLKSTKIETHSSITSPSLSHNIDLIHRIELVVDDEEDSTTTTTNTAVDENPAVKLRQNGTRKVIVERPGYESGCFSTCMPETLVIDDVRQSTMLDIDGLTHVYKNEVTIESDQTDHKMRNRVIVDNNTSSTVSYEPLKIPVLNKPAASSSSSHKLIIEENQDTSRQQLYEELRNIHDKLSDVEFEFAKQNALSESPQVLKLQYGNFQSVANRFNESLPKYNEVLQSTRSWLSAPSQFSNSRIREDMSRYAAEITTKIENIVDQIETRQVKFQTATDLLNKFDSDHGRCVEQLTVVDDQIEKLRVSYLNALMTESHDNRIKLLGINEAELKRLANLLHTTHKSNLAQIRLNYENYAQLTDSFTKDLQLFCSKCNDKRIKHMSADLYSDLTCIKSNTENCDNKYQLLVSKLSTLQDTYGAYTEMERIFADRCVKFNEWLDDIEHRIHSETNKIKSSSASTSVKQYEEAAQRFQTFKTTIQLERKSLYEIKKHMDSLIQFVDKSNNFGPSLVKTITARYDGLKERYQVIESLQADMYAYLLDQTACARNLKENVDITNTWLNDIEAKYVNLNEPNQPEVYDRLKSEIVARRESLLKVVSSSMSNSKREPKLNESNQKTVDQLLAKLDTVSKKLDTKSSKIKQIQSLVDQFSTTYDKICMQCNKSANRLDSIDSSPNSAALSLNHTLPSIMGHARTCDEIIADLDETEQKLLYQSLETCLGQIEALPFKSELISQSRLDQMVRETADLKQDITQIRTSAKSRLGELSQLKDALIKHDKLKTEFEHWLNKCEIDLSENCSLAIPIMKPDLIQSNLIEPIIQLGVQHAEKQLQLNDVNQSGNECAEMFDKFIHNRENVDQMILVSPRLNQLRRKASSRSNENLDTRTATSPVNVWLIDLRKINETYKWLEEKIQTRNLELKNLSTQSNILLKELTSCREAMNEYETELAGLFNATSLNDMNLLRLPLLEASVDTLADLKRECTRMDPAARFNDQLVALKFKSRQYTESSERSLVSIETSSSDLLRNTLGQLNDELTRLVNTHAEIKNMLDKFMLTNNSYKSTLDSLVDSLNRKVQLIETHHQPDQMRLTPDLNSIENQIKSLDQSRSELLKHDAKQLEVLNRLANYLIEHGSHESQFTSQHGDINSRYNIVVDDMAKLCAYKHKVKDSIGQVVAKKTKLDTEIEHVDAKCAECEKNLANLLTNTNLTQLTSVAKKCSQDVEKIENESLHECKKLSEGLSNVVTSLIDSTRSYMIMNGHGEFNQDEITPLVDEAKQALQDRCERVHKCKQDIDKFNSKQLPFLAAYASLREFMNKKSQQIDQISTSSNSLSAVLATLVIQQRQHESLMKELLDKDAECKRLNELYAQYDDEEEQESAFLARMTQMLNEVESSWSVLCARAEVRKEKIFVAHTLCEEFERVHAHLTKRLDQFDQSIKSVPIEQSGDIQAVHYELGELESEKSSMLVKLNKLGDELRHSCTSDLDHIAARCQALAVRFDLAESRLRTRLDMLERQKSHEDQIMEVKSTMERFETELNDSSSASRLNDKLKTEIKSKLDKIKLGVTGTDEEIKRLEEVYKSLEEKVDEKINTERRRSIQLVQIQQDLIKMDENMKNIYLALENETPSDELDLDQIVEQKEKQLDNMRDLISELTEQLAKANQEIEKNGPVDADNESSQLVRQLNKTVELLNERCALLSTRQQEESQQLRDQADKIKNWTSECDDCIEDVERVLNELDSKFNPTSNETSHILDELSEFEQTVFSPFKSKLERLSLQLRDGSITLEPSMNRMKTRLSMLHDHMEQLNNKLVVKTQKLSQYIQRTASFDTKREQIEAQIIQMQQKLTDLNETKFNLDNLNEIGTQLSVISDSMTNELIQLAGDADELKEIAERLVQEDDSEPESDEEEREESGKNDKRDLIQKQTNIILRQVGILQLKLDERRLNLNFLNMHLVHLGQNAVKAQAFLADVATGYNSDLKLNCIDPIVMKLQFDKLKQINDRLVDSENLLVDIRLDAASLLTLHSDFVAVQQHSILHLNEIIMENDEVNRYLTCLPKTVSADNLASLDDMFDKPAIESRVERLCERYDELKSSLDADLALVKVLYPLCEKLSQTLSSIGQSLLKSELELEWLKQSDDNETSPLEMERQFEELQRVVAANEQTLIQLNAVLVSRILDELRQHKEDDDSKDKSDEDEEQSRQDYSVFLDDMNHNLTQTRHKLTELVGQLYEFSQLLAGRKQKSNELFNECDQLLDNMYKLDGRFMQIECVAHEPSMALTDSLRAQIDEVAGLNDQVLAVRQRLNELQSLSKQLIRTRHVEDSIELKEKFNTLAVQADQLTKTGTTKLNEIEQAHAIAKAFSETHHDLTQIFFEEVSSKLNQLEVSSPTETSVDLDDGNNKDSLKYKLNVIKYLEKQILEKKVDVDTMNKNGIALARLCNKNSSSFPFGSASFSSNMYLANQMAEDEVLVKDCKTSQELKQLMHATNRRYEELKTLVNNKRDELETILWKSTGFDEKLDSLTNGLKSTMELCEYAEPVSAQPDRLRVQLDDNKQMFSELNKRKNSLDCLKDFLNSMSGNESTSIIVKSPSNETLSSSLMLQPMDPSTLLNNERKLNELEELWAQLRDLSELRGKHLEDTLDCAQTFWSDFTRLTEVVNDLEERLKQLESETVAIDPDLVMEQQQYYEQIVRIIADNEENIVYFKEMGQKLLDLCRESPDQSEVSKTIEELDTAWQRIKQLVRDREIELQDTFGQACEFQQELIDILEWISLQQEKFVNLESNFTSQDPKTIRFQINLLKEFKERDVDPELVKIQELNQKFNDLKTNTKTNQSFDVLESLQEPLNNANKEWKRLQASIVERKAMLQHALLESGQYSEALDEIDHWMSGMCDSLDRVAYEIPPVDTQSEVNMPSLELESAKLKILNNDIKAQEQSVVKLIDTCTRICQNESLTHTINGTTTNLDELKGRVDNLVDSWRNLLGKLHDQQDSLNSRIDQASSLCGQMQDTLNWIDVLEREYLPSNKLYGGLPETAREQLDKFINSVQSPLDSNEQRVIALIEKAQAEIMASGTNRDRQLEKTMKQLSQRWPQLKRKAEERREKLEKALEKAGEFNDKLTKFTSWLAETEKHMSSLKPVSRVLEILTSQIGAHQQLQKNITEHRADCVEVDRLGTHLKYFSQKQDVILIKNRLISTQNRWEKLVSRSAERTKDLERGYKETKQFYDLWQPLIEYLNQTLSVLAQEQSQALGTNNPTKIKQLLAKHKEFHRSLMQKQPQYDSAVKLGRRLADKFDSDAADRAQLQEILNEVKSKWQAASQQSTERQKRLEDALLCSGQFRDALLGLLEWLKKIEPTLADNATSLNGDLDCVMALMEDNQQFQSELRHKAEQVKLIQQAATDLLKHNSTDSVMSNELKQQLGDLETIWQRVDSLAAERSVRLQKAHQLASQFHQQTRARLDWLNKAEHDLKSSGSINLLTDNQGELMELIESHQAFCKDLSEQSEPVTQCLALGQEILADCIPESASTLTHWLAVVQTKWMESNRLAQERTQKLDEALSVCRENENMLDELLAWLQGAEATLTALEQKSIPSNLEIVEQLLQDHQDFQNEIQSRQTNVERITKSSSIRDTASLYSMMSSDPMNKKKMTFKMLKQQQQQTQSSGAGWRTPEPKIRNPRVKLLFDRWRRVWLLSSERQRKLKEAIDRLREMERLKNFSFDEWRRRYMNWHKDNRARITDFFRRQDRDHDGKISREEFIQGILHSNFPTSRLELEAVADIFDLDKDGFIDYKEFLATLKPTAAIQPNVERIRDEVQRQVALCKCSKRYHVLQVSERHYRFGDSQKLRLVRILQSTVMVRVGGGWVALDEFLVKNDPCRGRDIFNEFIKTINKFSLKDNAKGRTNFEIRGESYMSRDSNLNSPISLSGYSRAKSPVRVNTSSTLTTNSAQKSRSGGASTSSAKHTPQLSQSNELLMIAASPMPASSNNSHSGSLGASISDLSSEAHSEQSDTNTSGAGSGLKSTVSNNKTPETHTGRKSSIPSLTKTTTSASGTSTPTKGGGNSRLPIPKK